MPHFHCHELPVAPVHPGARVPTTGGQESRAQPLGEGGHGGSALRRLMLLPPQHSSVDLCNGAGRDRRLFEPLERILQRHLQSRLHLLATERIAMRRSPALQGLQGVAEPFGKHIRPGCSPLAPLDERRSTACKRGGEEGEPQPISHAAGQKRDGRERRAGREEQRERDEARTQLQRAGSTLLELHFIGAVRQLLLLGCRRFRHAAQVNEHGEAQAAEQKATPHL
mmetsp:Transcript_17045/g.64980  ORF Transcript_17045/g.64980 Transcript_17045/m.64980 type:complete len:225 (+) Transcript_17045:1381-2055(+)